MSDLKKRLQALNAFDIALLLQDAFNGIQNRIDLHQHEDAQRMLSWWEKALNVNPKESLETIRELRANGDYQRAALDFSRTQQFRTRAINYLKTAIDENSQRKFDRWRWSGRAYGQAICNFLDIQKKAAALRRFELEIESVTHTIEIRNFQVLHMHLQYRMERIHDELEVNQRYHNGFRAHEVMEVCKRLETKRKKLIEQRDTLLDMVRLCAGKAVAMEVLGGTQTVKQQICTLKYVLRQKAQLETEAQADQMTSAYRQELYSTFNRYTRTGLTFLSALMIDLPTKKNDGFE